MTSSVRRIVVAVVGGATSTVRIGIVAVVLLLLMLLRYCFIGVCTKCVKICVVRLCLDPMV